MAILSKACKQDNFKSQNSLKVSFTNIWGFCCCKSFLESNSPDILALCETNLDDSIDSGNFLVRGYLPLIRKDSNMHSLAVYVKEGLPFAQELSLENSTDSYLCFQLALLHSVSYFFFLYRSPSLSLCTVFDSISLNRNEVLWIHPSAKIGALIHSMKFLSSEFALYLYKSTILSCMEYCCHSGAPNRIASPCCLSWTLGSLWNCNQLKSFV